MILLPFVLPISSEANGKPTYMKKMQLGQLLYFNGNLEQSIKAFKYAIYLKPDAFEPHLNLVNLYVQKQDIPAAIVECHEVLKLKPDHKDVYLILGNLMRNQASSETNEEERNNKLDKATEYISKAVDQGANKALCYNTLGVIHLQRGKDDEALEHIEKAIDLKDNMPDAHLLKGVLHVKKGKKEESLKHFDKAIKLKGKFPEAHNTKGDVLFSMGKHDEAFSAYEKALEDDPRYYQSLLGMANIHIHKKEYEKALDLLEKAKGIKENDKNILYSLGVCYEKLNQTPEAIHAFTDGVMLEQNVMLAAQIKLHIQQLQKGQLFNLPQLETYSTEATLLTPAQAAEGAGQAGSKPPVQLPNAIEQRLLGGEINDLIKIKKPAGKEESLNADN